MQKAERTYFSPPATIIAMGELFSCGCTNPDTYTCDAGVAANTIRLRIAEFKRQLPLAIASVRPDQRVEEVSARTGAAPAGASGVAMDSDCEAGDDDVDDDATDSPLHFWSNLKQAQAAEYEGAIERFFVHPHIAAVYARLEVLESDQHAAELSILCDAFTQGIQPLGYVYVAWNPLFGDLLKIGATMRTPAIRLRELSGAGVPEPFELVAYVQTANPFELEKTIHRHFNAVRKYGRRKEFFTLTHEAAIAHFKSIGGYDAAERPPPQAPSASKKRKAASE